MKVILLITFLLVSYKAFAPEFHWLPVPEPIKIDPYKSIKYAIGKVEVFANGYMDTLAINQTEQAYGYFQIRQIRIDDYYTRTGIRYTLRDMLDYKKAERVFQYYAAQIGFKNPGEIARRWNGTGPQTWEYWKKVRNYLII
jgi:hypothetical protein